jgi:polysaccharide biosynthesis/export protein
MPKAVEGTIAPVDTHKYLLGPEDVIFIRVWRQPDFTGPVTVRPDGKITLPLVGDLQAAGLTPEKLGVSIKEALTQFINSPDVQVSVTDVRSKKYFIDGEVKRTGPYPLVTATTVLEALSNCGGFQDFANRKDIHILRGSKILHFNWSAVTKGKKLEQNIELENGDHIIVR